MGPKSCPHSIEKLFGLKMKNSLRTCGKCARDDPSEVWFFLWSCHGLLSVLASEMLVILMLVFEVSGDFPYLKFRSLGVSDVLLVSPFSQLSPNLLPEEFFFFPQSRVLIFWLRNLLFPTANRIKFRFLSGESNCHHSLFQLQHEWFQHKLDQRIRISYNQVQRKPQY